jgi:hypothetical protein
MPRMRARYPLAGPIAFVVTLTALSVQFALFAVPHKADKSADVPADTNARAYRAAEEDKSRAVRLVAGLAVLGIGSGLGGAAALVATRGRSTDRIFAAGAGACCLASAVVWLAAAVACVVAAPNRESPEPVLIIARD